MNTNRVKILKHKLNCCISKKIEELLKERDNLNFNVFLNTEIQQLNLYSYALESLSCDEIPSSNFVSKIQSLCGDICFDCDDEQVIKVDEFYEDDSDYDYGWIPYEIECEGNLDHIWIPFIECCEQDQDYIWIPLAECCEQEIN